MIISTKGLVQNASSQLRTSGLWCDNVLISIQHCILNRAHTGLRILIHRMSNIAHYQTDYAAKSILMIGSELCEQCVAVERLRAQEIRDGVQKTSANDLTETGRKTLIRLQTAANRAALNKLLEIVFQMLLQHERHQLHQPWTFFVEGVLYDAFCASQWRKVATSRIAELA